MPETTKMIRVYPDAHRSLEHLCELIAKEKGLRNINFTEAASLAIKEAIETREREARITTKAARERATVS
jgi:hypothetical protein